LRQQIFSLILTITLFSCKPQTSDKQFSQVSFKDKVSDNQDLFGKWTMCATSGNGTMIQMNVCPTITFGSTGTGYDGDPVFCKTFTWTLKKRQLKIMYSNKTSSETFPDTSYFVSFNKQSKGIDLIIEHDDHYFYLSK
jgi:hypothetical protein